MTDEEIEKIKEYIEIHARKEPHGIKITEIMRRAVKELESLKDGMWFVFETNAGNWGMDKATEYTVDRHNYFYGTREDCHKWAAEHKVEDYTGHKYCYDKRVAQLDEMKEVVTRLCEGISIERKLNKTEKQSDFLNTQIDSAEEFIEKDYLKS